MPLRPSQPAPGPIRVSAWLLGSSVSSERTMRSWAPRASRRHLGPPGTDPRGALHSRPPAVPATWKSIVRCPPATPRPPRRDSLQRTRDAKAVFLTLLRLNFLSPTSSLHPVCHPELHECGTHGSAGVPMSPHHIREHVSQTPGRDIQSRFRGTKAPTPAHRVPVLLRTARRLGDSSPNGCGLFVRQETGCTEGPQVPPRGRS